MSLRKAHAVHVRNTADVLKAELSMSRDEVSNDLATHAFLEAAIEIMAMSDAEFQARLPEFGFAAAAVISRIARGAQ